MPKRYVPNDKWSCKATEAGYRARSVFKLMELNEKFKLIKAGMTVVDLGAAPGSWLQYIAEHVGPKGKTIGIDLQEIDVIERVQTYVADITDTATLDQILTIDNRQLTIDLILSDLAPKTSGIKDVDQWKSVELCEAVMDVARSHLKPKGAVVMKILRGADFDEFLRNLKQECTAVKTFQAQASRDRSTEIYIIVRT